MDSKVAALEAELLSNSNKIAALEAKFMKLSQMLIGTDDRDLVKAHDTKNMLHLIDHQKQKLEGQELIGINNLRAKVVDRERKTNEELSDLSSGSMEAFRGGDMIDIIASRKKKLHAERCETVKVAVKAAAERLAAISATTAE